MAAGIAACVGTQATQTTNTTDQQQTQDQAPATEDLVIEGFDEVKLTGLRFVPEGFGQPGMVRVVPKKKLPLDKQRKSYTGAKTPEAKAAEAKILVTMLWDMAKETQNQDEAKALRQEVLGMLRELHTSIGDKFDDILLQMWFTAEVWVGDEAGALSAGSELMSRYGSTPSAQALAAWVAYYQLRAWKTDEAAKIVEGWSVDSMDPNTDYQRAYVLAWVAFRKGNFDTARKAIVWAAKNWKSRATQPAVERDFLLMLSRSGTPVDEAAALLAELSGGNKEVQFVWLYKIYEGYELTGFNLHAAGALDKALQALGDQVPPDNRVVILQRMSNNYLIAHEPDKAADTLIAAHKAVAACGEKCAGKDKEIADQIAKLAPHFHTTYTTTHDARFHDAAKKLYDYYVSLNLQDSATVKSYLTQLQETKERLVPNSGKHDKTTMEWSTAVRSQAVKGCYEEVLQREPELKGSLKLMLNVDASGQVIGVETEPAAGEMGMAAVGKCLQERARDWKFPGRSKKGTTALSRPYVFEPAQGGS